MKFGGCFSNLLEIKCAQFYLDLYRFDISIVRYLGGYFFPNTVYNVVLVKSQNYYYYYY